MAMIIKMANAAGALAVTRMGSQPSLPTLVEVSEANHEKDWRT